MTSKYGFIAHTLKPFDNADYDDDDIDQLIYQSRALADVLAEILDAPSALVDDTLRNKAMEAMGCKPELRRIKMTLKVMAPVEIQAEVFAPPDIDLTTREGRHQLEELVEQGKIGYDVADYGSPDLSDLGKIKEAAFVQEVKG